MSGDALSGIAVVGLACRFPGAPDPAAFWRNLREGVESISFLSEEELLASGVPASVLADPRYVRAKGVLDDIERFDAGFFHLTPREAERMDPQHRLFLEVCWEALEDAGCDPARFPGPIGVYGGETLGTYLFHLASHPDIGPEVMALQNVLGLDREFLTTMVSYKLDLRGPSFTLQTACSTSLVAVAVACQSLKSFECDLALAGGVSVRVPPRTGYFFQEGGIESPDGHCRSYDADARGTVGGDGAGAVALKRLEDALRDGDPIRAVIRGWALNNDGSHKVGFTAPSIEGQAEAIAVAHALAGVDPETITFVEGHGTGTPLGDPIEVAALTRVFRESTDRRGFCALGAVKSNVGHLDAAAGVAGLIKTVLALENAEIPPTLHFRRPNPETKLETSPFYVNAATVPWRTAGHPRRAGVSSFGLGGTNAHVVVEEAPEPAPEGSLRPAQLLVLSARSAAALDATAARLAAWIGRHPQAHLADVALVDVAWTLQAGRRAHRHRRALVARDLEEAARLLSAGGGSSRAADRRPAFFLLPGQGVLRAGAGRELYRQEPGFRARIDRCAARFRSAVHLDLVDLIDPPPGREREAEERLARYEVAHPVLFALEHALAGLWMDWGVRPAALLGHSLGEWTAACLAGVFSAEDTLELLAVRGRLMDGLPLGAMLSVPLPECDLLPFLGDGLELSGINASALCSVSGPVDAVERLRAELEAREVQCRRIDADRAFHSSALDGLARQLARLVAGVERRPPEIPFLSNRTGTWIEPAQAVDPEYWGFHVRHPVRFGDGMTELLGSGAAALIEVGPGGTLGGLARRQPERLGDRPVLASLPAPREGEAPEPETVSLLAALGRFWAAGGTVDWDAFQEGRRRRKLSLPTYPFERRRYWVDLSGGDLPASALAAAPVAHPAPLDPALPDPSAVEEPGEDRPELERAYEPPRTETERRVAALWTQVLGIERVGLHDDFYALGGDSLRALDLLARVRRTFSVELPLRALLESSDVAGLAALLEPGEGTGVEEPRLPGGLVLVRDGGGRAPLFLVHPAGGHVFGYRPLAERLAADRPVYGLEARGVEPGETPWATVEEMAAEHVDSLLALRRGGPWLLGGASMGGTVAWEMARQLRARGERIGLVALFDTPGPGQMPAGFADESEALTYLVGSHLGLTAGDLRALEPGERLRLVLGKGTEAGVLPPELDVERARALLDLFLLHTEAMLRFRPAPLDGRVAFFRAAERRPVDPAHPELAWIDLARDGIEVHVVPGDHGTMYQPPHVEVLARRLGRCLEALA